MPSKCASISVQRAVWLSFGLAWLTLSCNVYDPDLSRAAIRSQASAGAPGTEANAASVASPATAGEAPATTPSEFPDEREDASVGLAPPACGDGIVNGAEKCDVAISAGAPGACPDSCPPLEPCVPRVRNGDDCQAACVLRELTCQSGDGCCPGKCTKDNDRDCSARCGDGIVQESSGETCEMGSERPCRHSDEDCADSDVCTRDVLTGSADNCNAACSHLALEAETSGDGCCPPTANANTDHDCQPRCGNGAREGDEECDGTAGCDAGCKDIARAERIRCMAAAITPCEQCACMQCASTELACLLGAEAESNRLCRAILTCAQANNCVGTPCYCGSLGCGLSYGPCRAPIEEAVGGDPQIITRDSQDPSKPLGRAFLADTCRVDKCQSACR